ncbi:MAG: hypothetical protein WBK91_00205 [Alphaproteobacteria bacterium]
MSATDRRPDVLSHTAGDANRNGLTARQEEARLALQQFIKDQAPSKEPAPCANNFYMLRAQNYKAVYDTAITLCPDSEHQFMVQVTQKIIQECYAQARKEVVGEYPSSIRGANDIRNAFKQARKTFAFRWRQAGVDDVGKRLPFAGTLKNFIRNLDVGVDSPYYRESPQVYEAAQRMVKNFLTLKR